MNTSIWDKHTSTQTSRCIQTCTYWGTSNGWGNCIHHSVWGEGGGATIGRTSAKGGGPKGMPLFPTSLTNAVGWDASCAPFYQFLGSSANKTKAVSFATCRTRSRLHLAAGFIWQPAYKTAKPFASTISLQNQQILGTKKHWSHAPHSQLYCAILFTYSTALTLTWHTLPFPTLYFTMPHPTNCCPFLPPWHTCSILLAGQMNSGRA